jgi:hypothetical protein
VIRDRGKYFNFSIASRPILGPTRLRIQWVPGIFPRGREADYSPPSSAEVKNDGAISPLPSILSWRDAYLIKQRGYFTFIIQTQGIKT